MRRIFQHIFLFIGFVYFLITVLVILPAGRSKGRFRKYLSKAGNKCCDGIFDDVFTLREVNNSTLAPITFDDIYKLFYGRTYDPKCNIYTCYHNVHYLRPTGTGKYLGDRHYRPDLTAARSSFEKAHLPPHNTENLNSKNEFGYMRRPRKILVEFKAGQWAGHYHENWMRISQDTLIISVLGYNLSDPPTDMGPEYQKSPLPLIAFDQLMLNIRHNMDQHILPEDGVLVLPFDIPTSVALLKKIQSTSTRSTNITRIFIYSRLCSV